MTNRATTLLVLAAGCMPLLAAAQIYRWVDPAGQVHFTQKPPASGPYKNVTPDPAAIAPATQGRGGSTASGDPNLRARADNAERCAKARERISFLEEKTSNRLYKTGEDGSPVPLTQEEFEQQLDDAKAAGQKYCG